MRPGHGSPVRASLGQAGLLPRVLPVAADGGAPAQLQLLGPEAVRKGVATRPPLFQYATRGHSLATRLQLNSAPRRGIWPMIPIQLPRDACRAARSRVDKA